MADQSLTEFYHQQNGNLEPFTKMAYDPYYMLPSMGGLPTAPAQVPQIQMPQVQAQVQQPPQQQEQPPTAIFYNPASKSYKINGYEVPEDDETTLAQYDQLMAARPGNSGPSQGDVPVDNASFNKMVGDIRNPSTARLFSRNVGIGVDQLQQLGGYAMQFTGIPGIEDMGKSIAEAQDRDMAKTSVYNRDLDSIKDRGAVEWFVAQLGQQVPNLVLAAASGGAGGAIGGVARGAAGAALRGIGNVGMRVAGKKIADKAVLAAAQKYMKQEALTAAEKALLTKAANGALEKSAMDAVAKNAIRSGMAAQRAGGATVGAYTSNLGVAIGDLYGESLANGGEGDRVGTLLKAPAYALAETIPEVMGAAMAFKPRGVGKAVTAGAQAAGKSPATFMGNVVRGTGKTLWRAGKGFATGAIGEGTTEAVQEALVMSNNPNLSAFDLSNPEVRARYANSFAAGAAVGATVGGVGNTLRRNAKAGAPTNLLEAVGENKPDATQQVVEHYAQQGVDLTGPNRQSADPQAQMEQQITFLMNQGFTPEQAVQIIDQQMTNAHEAAGYENEDWDLNKQMTGIGSQGAYSAGAGNAYTDMLNANDQQAYTQGLQNFANQFGQTQQGIQQGIQDNQLAQQALNTQAYYAATHGGAVPSWVNPNGSMSQQQAGDVYGAAAQQQADMQNYAMQFMQNQQNIQNNAATQAMLNQAAQGQAQQQAEWQAQQDMLRKNAIRERIAREQAAAAEYIRKRTEFQNQLAQQAAQNDPALQQQRAFLAQPPGAQGNLFNDYAGDQLANAMPTNEQVETEQAPSVAPGQRAMFDEQGYVTNEGSAKRTENRLQQKQAEKAAKAAEAKKAQEKQNKLKAQAEAKKAKAEKAAKDKLAAQEAKAKAAKEAQEKARKAAKAKSEAEAAKRRQERNEIQNRKETFQRLPTGTQGDLFNNYTEETKPRETEKPATQEGKPRDEVPPGQKKLFNDKGEPTADATKHERAKPKKPSTPGTQGAGGNGASASQQGNSASQTGTTQTLSNDLMNYYLSVLEDKQESREMKQAVIDVIANKFTALTADADKSAFLSTVRNAIADRNLMYPVKLMLDKLGILTDIEVERQNEIDLRKAREAARREAQAAKKAQVKPEPQARFLRSDGTEVGKPMSIGAVKLKIKSILSGYAVKPDTNVYANLEDFKRNNPELYEQAKKAYPDFDKQAKNAMGYSFGDKVVLFSDNIYSNEQIANTMSHESIGHVGLRSVMDEKTLNKTLQMVYDSSVECQREVKNLMDKYGISQMEATEEYLADKAATLDNSMLRRVWATIKRCLNKIGCTFDDDMALAVINQARKYIREGRLDNASAAMGAKVKPTGRFLIGQVIASQVNNNNNNSQAPLSNINYTSSLNIVSGLPSLTGSMSGFFTGMRSLLGNPSTRKGIVQKILNAVDTMGNWFRTLDDVAKVSKGAQMVFDIFKQRENAVRTMQAELNKNLPLTRDSKTTVKDKDLAGELLAYNALYRSAMTNLADVIKNMPTLLVENPDGSLSLDESQKDKFINFGITSADDFRNGIEIDNRTKLKDANGNDIYVGDKYTYKVDVKDDSQAYKVFVEQRKAINQAAWYVLQGELAKATGAFSEFNESFDKQFNQLAQSLNGQHAVDTLKKISALYTKMRRNAIKLNPDGTHSVQHTKLVQADELLRQVIAACTSDDVIMAWQTGTKIDPKNPSKGGIPASFFKNNALRPEFQFLQTEIANLKKAQVTTQQIEEYRRILHRMAIDTDTFSSAVSNFKQTIAKGYVPFTRRGSKQVTLVAYDNKGKRVDLHHSFTGLMPRFHGEETFLRGTLAELEKLFPDGNVHKVLDSDGIEVDVTLVPEYSNTEATAPLASEISVGDFIRAMKVFNINLDAVNMENVLRNLVAGSDAAMHRLQRQGNPGWDANMIRSAAEYMVSCCNIAGASRYQHQLTYALSDNRNWLGDKQVLADLAQEVKNAQTEEERRIAQRNYDEYAYMYMHMAPESRNNKVIVNGKERACLGKGNVYKEKVKEVVRWAQNRSNIANVTGDILNSSLGSKFRAFTVMGQLGGSVATAVINTTSLFTNSLPYFASYNANTATGLGHGFCRSAAALSSAVVDLKNYKLSDLDYLEQLKQNRDFAKHNLTEDELDFLIDLTRKGELQAAQYNHLMGDAQGRAKSNLTVKAIQAWMSMFTYTEQLNRRATALAAFRLELERGTDKKAASAIATKAIDATQGNYDAYNRPALGRHNLGQYMYMYKQFTVTTLQLLKNMDYQGKLTMLGMLMLCAGMKGIPFADDLMDLIDTLCQGCGMKRTSVEGHVIKFIDELAPGMAPWFMRGIVDNMTGATISSRIGLGDIIPLTGALKAGANPWQQSKDFLGPMVSGMTGTVGSALSLARYAGEAVGLREGKTDMLDIGRESQISAVRSLADSIAYLKDGAVTNNTGAVIGKGVSVPMIMARLMGFFPAAGTLQNDIVRLAKQDDAYLKETKAAYIGAFARAAVANDRRKMQNIIRSVNAWNATARTVSPSLVIRDFVKAAYKAARAAKMPTGERHLKVASKSIRGEEKRMLAAYGY